MHLKHSIVTAILLSLFIHQALAATDTLAIRQLQFAFNACERGLQSEKPESQGSFRVLQSLLKKYENNRDSALQKVPNLKDSDTERYSGTLLDGKTFAEAYQTCENELYEKILSAEQYINEKREKRKARQQAHQAEVEATLQKINQAKQEITVAINQNCMQFMLAPTTTSRHLYDNYLASKQKALAIYPKIVKQFHDITTVDPDTNESTTETKTVQYWFEHCEEAFAEQGYGETAEIAASSPPKTETTTPLPIGLPIEAEQPTDGMTSMNTSTMSSMASMTMDDNMDDDVVPNEDEDAEMTDTMNDEEDDMVGMSGMSGDTGTEESTAATDMSEDTAEYQATLAKVQGDRTKILTDEGRLPDFNNDEEGIIENASEWQYETEDGNQCTIYTFKDNALVHTKSIKGECI